MSDRLAALCFNYQERYPDFFLPPCIAPFDPYVDGGRAGVIINFSPRKIRTEEWFVVDDILCKAPIALCTSCPSLCRQNCKEWEPPYHASKHPEVLEASRINHFEIASQSCNPLLEKVIRKCNPIYRLFSSPDNKCASLGRTQIKQGFLQRGPSDRPAPVDVMRPRLGRLSGKLCRRSSTIRRLMRTLPRLGISSIP